MSAGSRIEALFAAGQLDRARRAIKKVLAQDPGDVDALIGKARLQALDGAHAKALDLLNELIDKHPDLIAARTYKAVVLELMGKQKTAEVLLKAATRIDPTFAPARYNLARHLARAGDSDAAIEQLEQAAAIDPDNPTYTLRIAELLLELGDEGQAGEVLTALISSFPGFSYGWLLAARAYMARAEPRKSIAVLAASVEHCPTDVPMAIATFQAAAAVGDLALCEQAIKVVAELDEAFAGQLEKVLAIVKVRRDEELKAALAPVHAAQASEISYFLQTIADACSNKKRALNLKLAARQLQKLADLA